MAFAQTYLFPRIISALRVSPANFEFLLQDGVSTYEQWLSTTGLEAPISTFEVAIRPHPRRAISLRKRASGRTKDALHLTLPMILVEDSGNLYPPRERSSRTHFRQRHGDTRDRSSRCHKK